MEHIKNLIDESSSPKFLPHLKPEYDNQIILITGAAGSIGSEIVSQLLFFNYKKLILLDISESSIYNLQHKFKRCNLKNVELVIGDVRDSAKMKFIFTLYKPTIIFHTAAYKHVPLMELNPYEAIKLNLYSTKLLADLAITHNVKKFVFISTDKAVNPINIMGATKRIAELYLDYLWLKHYTTNFYIARFGNILWSNGSVIPLFKKQFEMGGPITVTHIEASRYFISISKASRLILETVAMNLNVNTFTFNMGNSIKIIDIAEALISSLSKRKSKKIEIEITGLRIGEKLKEDLISMDEKLVPTGHKDIMSVISNASVIKDLEIKMSKLLQITPNDSKKDIEIKIKTILPKYLSKH